MGRMSRAADEHLEMCRVEKHPRVSSSGRKEGKFSSYHPRDSLGESLFVIQTCIHPKVEAFAVAGGARGFLFRSWFNPAGHCRQDSWPAGRTVT